MSMYEEQPPAADDRYHVADVAGVLMAACTPNSLPDAAGHVEHGFQINVFDEDVNTLATIDLPDWESFQPESAGHRLIEHGYTIHPAARAAVQTVAGWRRTGSGMMTQVIRTDAEKPARGAVHPIQRLHMVALGAAAAAGIDDPDAHEELFQGIVWVGDFAGWEVVPVLHATEAPYLHLQLRHRCGWAQRQPFEGITGDGAAYVGNIIERLLEAVDGHTCTPHQPSPEHQARMQRWTDSSSGGARPVVDREDGPQAGLLANGPMQAVDLETEGQRLFRQGRHAEAEIPLAREILGDEAAELLAARRAAEYEGHGYEVLDAEDGAEEGGIYQ